MVIRMPSDGVPYVRMPDVQAHSASVWQPFGGSAASPSQSANPFKPSMDALPILTFRTFERLYKRLQVGSSCIIHPPLITYDRCQTKASHLEYILRSMNRYKRRRSRLTFRASR